MRQYRSWSLLSAVFGLATLLASPALAWNCRGHMIVAAVAWHHIDPAKKSRLKALLDLNPDAATWRQQAGSLDVTEAEFLQAACWPDDIKSNPDYHNSPGGQPDVHAHDNVGYVDHWRHRDWHYKDIPFSPDGTPVEQADDPNAQTQIEAFRSALSSAADDDIKSYDLVWLIHLVGDVHQPLHATSRFISTDTNGDGGGNDVCLEGALDQYGKCPNLHSYWDGLFGTSRVVSAANHYATASGTRKLPTPAAADVAISDVSYWLKESEKLAESDAYATPILVGLGPYELSGPDNAAALYHDHALSTARSQVSLAGRRLADLINANLH